jgi:hypothetical protein
MGFAIDQWLSPPNFGGDSSSFSAGGASDACSLRAGNFGHLILCFGRDRGRRGRGGPISEGLNCNIAFELTCKVDCIAFELIFDFMFTH